MNRNRIIISLVIILAIVILVVLNQNEKEQSIDGKQTVKIGVMLPLTGGASYLGQGAKNAIELALKQNVKDTNKYNYEVIFEDDQLNTGKAKKIVDKFAMLDRVNAVMSFFTSSGQVVNPVAEKYKIIHMANTWEESVAEGKYNFVQAMRKTTVSENFLELIQSKKGVKNILVITSTRSGSYSAAEIMSEKLKEAGYNVYLEALHKGTKDFDPTISRYKDKNIDIYALSILPPEIDILVKQLHINGIKNDKITGVASFDTSANLNIFEGVEFATVAQEKDTYRKAYMNEYNDKPTYFGSISYDSMGLLINSYEENYIEGKIPSADVIAEYILNLKEFDCSTKCVIEGSDGLISNPSSIKKIVNGEIIVIKE